MLSDMLDIVVAKLFNFLMVSNINLWISLFFCKVFFDFFNHKFLHYLKLNFFDVIIVCFFKKIFSIWMYLGLVNL